MAKSNSRSRRTVNLNAINDSWKKLLPTDVIHDVAPINRFDTQTSMDIVSQKVAASEKNARKLRKAAELVARQKAKT